jgi:hypothetical protein
MTQVVEEFYSADSWYKAEIRGRGDDVLEVVIFKWTYEIIPAYGEVCPPFWERVAGGPVLTNSLSTARSLGVEELIRLSGSVGWKSTWNRPDQEREESIEVTPGAEEESEGINQNGDASGSHSLELLFGIIGMTLFVTLLAFSFFVSPVVWWFYGPAWAIGGAIAAVVLFAFSPFRDLFAAVLLVNIIYCAFAVGKLIFF